MLRWRYSVLLVQPHSHQMQRKNMDEVENQSVIQEAAPLETSQQETVAQEVQQPVEDRQERNWKEMRRAKDELERKAKLQEELITRLMEQNSKTQVPVQQVADELDSVPDDDYIPKGQVKKLLKREREESRKEAREEIEKVFQEKEKSQFLERLRSKFSDFDDIVTPETMELLETTDPELATDFAKSNDPYSIGLKTYKYIKAMKIAEKVPESRRTEEVDKKLEQNAKTIQSPQAFDKRPMAQTFKLTESMKKDLYNEMMQYANLAGGVRNEG